MFVVFSEVVTVRYGSIDSVRRGSLSEPAYNETLHESAPAVMYSMGFAVCGGHTKCTPEYDRCCNGIILLVST